MILVRSDVRIWLPTGCTDMRGGMFGLALLDKQGLKRDPHAIDLYTLRSVDVEAIGQDIIAGEIDAVPAQRI